MTTTIDMSNSADNSEVVASDMAFSEYIAKGVHFDSAQLTRMVFTHCDMYWASFFLACLDDVTFDRCDLRGSDFKKATLKNCRFLSCDLGTDRLAARLSLTGQIYPQ